MFRLSSISILDLHASNRTVGHSKDRDRIRVDTTEVGTWVNDANVSSFEPQTWKETRMASLKLQLGTLVEVKKGMVDVNGPCVALYEIDKVGEANISQSVSSPTGRGRQADRGGQLRCRIVNLRSSTDEAARNKMRCQLKLLRRLQNQQATSHRGKK